MLDRSPARTWFTSSTSDPLGPLHRCRDISPSQRLFLCVLFPLAIALLGGEPPHLLISFKILLRFAVPLDRGKHSNQSSELPAALPLLKNLLRYRQIKGFEPTPGYHATPESLSVLHIVEGGRKKGREGGRDLNPHGLIWDHIDFTRYCQAFLTLYFCAL